MNRDYVVDSLKEGAGLIRLRWGLAVLLYAVNLVLAFLLALPVYFILVELVGDTGFGAELIEGFDVILWRELAGELVEVLEGIGWQIVWMLPLYAIWKTASYMGVIYALHSGAIWPFWRGVGYYTGQGLLVALAFLPMKIFWSVCAFLIAGSFASLWPGEVGQFWMGGVFFPILLLSGLAMLDLYQRYARIALVVRHDTVRHALGAGFSWPSKYGAASLLYLIWYALALITGVMTLGLNAILHVGTTAVLVGFLIQQVSFFTRAAVTVGWIGSEVRLFERTYIQELPLIADVEVYDDRPAPGEAPWA